MKHDKDGHTLIIGGYGLMALLLWATLAYMAWFR